MASTPPKTRREPLTETLHGVEISDPYRWLEGDTEDVAEWTAEQNAYADAHLDGPERKRLRERFEALAETTDYEPLRPAGGRYFQKVRAPDEEQHRLLVRESPGEEGRPLADPNERSGDGTVSLDWYVPSPDGSLLAYGVAPGGTEQYDVRVVDVDSGEEVDVVRDTGRGGAPGFAWHDAGFYYTRTAAPGEEGGQLDKEIRFHELGADPAEDRLVTDEVGERVWPVVEAEDDVLVVVLQEGWDSAEVHALRADPTVDDFELRPVVVGVDAAFEPTLADGTLYLRTDHGAPFSRVVRAAVEEALAAADPESLDGFEECVPERDAPLEGVEVCGDRLLAHYHREAHSELVVFDREGAECGDVPLPKFVSVADLRGEEGRTATFAMESFGLPPRICRARLDDGTYEEHHVADVRLDAGFDLDAGLEVTQEWFESADGTDVPAFVVRRSDVERDGDNPTLLTGYGGFRVDRTPTFDRFALPFLAAGGVYALATLRGGSEFGEEWHEAGRRGRKQNVFDDFLAVAEGLVDRGYTRPERLGIAGGSNGGLLVGAAATQRPELFGAVVCQVPLLDMLRFHRFLLGASWTTEYGHPEDSDAFEYLRAYSPYHNVAAVDYPPTLLTTAVGDTRVHPGHARKMTARLQNRTTGDGPILLRVREDAGHGVGKPRSMVVEERAEQWAFLAGFLGVDFD